MLSSFFSAPGKDQSKLRYQTRPVQNLDSRLKWTNVNIEWSQQYPTLSYGKKQWRLCPHLHERIQTWIWKSLSWSISLWKFHQIFLRRVSTLYWQRMVSLCTEPGRVLFASRMLNDSSLLLLFIAFYLTLICLSYCLFARAFHVFL